MEELKSIIIDLENGTYKLNGKDIGSTVSELHLDFEKGQWMLTVTVKTSYTVSGTRIRQAQWPSSLHKLNQGGGY